MAEIRHYFLVFEISVFAFAPARLDALGVVKLLGLPKKHDPVDGVEARLENVLDDLAIFRLGGGLVADDDVIAYG